ncbi:putative fumarylacetoacetase [Pilimelia terevasa]|uniref:fumarylacetoacetase n=1 Tax=Pilimelia terevasa TaxID=53372 RepID=A0A8J3FE33_9ACTN|nr:fumarylacetoacetase [Pilimelia terevasa]GGK12563.1 putative fumarylacetoacetase [Pilimelia terevasa]
MLDLTGPFGIHHLPYGVFTYGGVAPRVGVRVGDAVLDLGGAEAAGLIDAGGAFGQPTLNAHLAQGRAAWTAARDRITTLLRDESATLDGLVYPLTDVTLLLPFAVGDYVDFYSSEHHAANVGALFRPGSPPLLPNWKHLPIGYHGRAGTVVVSGTDVVRPCGQRKAPTADVPTYGPTGRLDIEAEVGFVVGAGTALGDRVGVADFADHVFGVVLVNDWSARDIQAWEYQPLGPFLGKSFATSVSAWVTPLAALEAAWVPAPAQDPAVLPYLSGGGHRGLDLALEVEWNGTVVSRPPFAPMYWTPAQQLAHLTVNGASVRPGDLYASGTVSGPERDQTGSFLELTWGGAEPVTVGDAKRTFLEDGDTVTVRATAPGRDGAVLALGEVTATVLPSR